MASEKEIRSRQEHKDERKLRFIFREHKSNCAERNSSRLERGSG
jgi:hypothetical protein